MDRVPCCRQSASAALEIDRLTERTFQHDAEGLPVAVRADRALAAVEDDVVVHREVLCEVVAAHALAPAVVHPCHSKRVVRPDGQLECLRFNDIMIMSCH